MEGRDGRTKEGRGGRAARTDREQTAPAGHFETFAKNASYMGGLREGWIEKHSNKEEAQSLSVLLCICTLPPMHSHRDMHPYRSITLGRVHLRICKIRRPLPPSRVAARECITQIHNT